MMQLKVFNNTEFGDIRTLERDGQPWFIGKDVAEVLEYSDTNKAIAMHVDDEDKLNDKTALSLGQRGGWIINESGLYSLIMSSKMPTAKSFKRWVTSEILPSIRKTGQYIQKALSPIEMLELQVKALKALEEKQVETEKAIADTNARLDVVKDTMQLSPNGWREESRKIISKVAQAIGGGTTAYQHVTNEIYSLVDERGRVSLEKRLSNKRHRMADEGVCKSKRNKVTKMDVIGEDAKLIEIYISIVREYAIKYLDTVA